MASIVLRRIGASLFGLSLLILPTPVQAQSSGQSERPWWRTMAGPFKDRDAFKAQATPHIPGFGGSYADEQGSLHVWLTEPEKASAMRLPSR
jgi:hypothetical protein